MVWFIILVKCLHSILLTKGFIKLMLMYQFLVSPLGDILRYLLYPMDDSTLLVTFHCYILYQLGSLCELYKSAKLQTL